MMASVAPFTVARERAVVDFESGITAIVTPLIVTVEELAVAVVVALFLAAISLIFFNKSWNASGLPVTSGGGSAVSVGSSEPGRGASHEISIVKIRSDIIYLRSLLLVFGSRPKACFSNCVNLRSSSLRSLINPFSSADHALPRPTPRSSTILSESCVSISENSSDQDVVEHSHILG